MGKFVLNIMIHGPIEYYTHYDNSPTEPFHMDAPNGMLLPYPIVTAGCSATKPNYAPLRIQCVNALINKGNITKLVLAIPS